MQQNKKELEKFIKGFVLKTPQVIIQSRMGEKIQTSGVCSTVSNSSNWFNISIDDYPEVVEDTKRALNLVSGDLITQRFPLSVEISLRTTEGDSMVLEVWSLGLATDRCDPTVRASHEIYNRMSILIKSLLSVSRVTPAYKLSRRQSADSYQILYRIYVGDAETHCLGDGQKQLRVGQLCTMVGTLSVSVSYRTKMTISPTQTAPGKDTGIMLKSDHFIKDLSPKQVLWQNTNINNNNTAAANQHHNNNNNNVSKPEKKSVDLTKPMKIGAFVDFNRTRKYSEDDYILPETPPFSWLLRKPHEDANNNNGDTGPVARVIAGEAAATNKENEGVGGCGEAKEEEEQQRQQKASLMMNNSQRPSRWSVSPTLDEEKFLKELHFPFATTNTPIGDLAKFYRECKQAPPLQGLSDEALPEEESEIDDLTQKLEEFETALPEFDSLVSSLYVQSTFEETCLH